MKNILIIAATEGEVLPFIQLPEQQRRGMDILVTGVGMIATAFAVGQKLATTRYDLLLNVGIAGSFDNNIALGEVVHIHQDTLAELGVEDGAHFIDSETLGLAQHTFYGSTDHGHTLISELRTCKGITVNKVHGNERTIDEVIRRINPDTESMEGAAAFYAAQQAGIPAIQVRAISNYIERRNKDNWRIPLAIANLNHWLATFADLQ
ncbi:futalosine hydrolase [Parapedobacter tibetensis]|uniref:futalosine hydrolase n=1 Tax=Parapedobacter tibetensis TaxID=2972951 RepID=UPI00214D415B|nr:futalosine hydrolase [Parapedobacter tibetensis]